MVGKSSDRCEDTVTVVWKSFEKRRAMIELHFKRILHYLGRIDEGGWKQEAQLKPLAGNQTRAIGLDSGGMEMVREGSYFLDMF